jgi:cobaltochelatase CobN
MHLLSAQAGALQQEGEAIDLAQAPGRFVFASSADSELMMLAGAADRAGEDDLRLANTLRLAHNLSIDMWIDKTVRHADLVVLRLIGGAAYFRYGVDELGAACANAGIPLVLLPGDATPDEILRQRSTIDAADWDRLLALFVAGGPDNADTILAAFHRLAAGRDLAELVPRPFARFGAWCPVRGIVDLPPPAPPVPGSSQCTRGATGRAFVPILFYRAALEGAGTATIEALIRNLVDRGLAPVPLLVSSLKDGACIAFVQQAFARFRPEIVVNMTGFSLGIEDLADERNPFAGIDAPILQVLQNSRPRAQWLADKGGLNAKDLAMQVVLPEIDGRSGMMLVGHKQDGIWHARTQCPLSAYAPDASGIARTADLAANWVRLRRTLAPDRRIALVLANYPLKDGRLANGVGYDAPQSTVEIMQLLAEAGYAIDPIPADGNALIAALQSGPTNANPQRGQGGAQLALADYATLIAALPETIQSAVTARWGAPDADPFVRDGAFNLPVLRHGNLAILLQPARGYDRDDTANYHDPDLVPPHAYLAAYLWLRHAFGAHVLIHNGKHGNLEWLPGKSVALDAESYPDLLWGQLPHLYPFIVNDPGEGTQAKRRTGAIIIDHLVPPLTRAESYGPLKELEALLDEYYAASGMDRRRLAGLKRQILDFSRDARLDQDIALPADPDAALIEIDNFLCELKEAQIRDGLHVFGQSPAGDLERDLLLALVRTPRGDAPQEASLIRALADDLALGFDPLTAKLGAPWTGPAIPGMRTTGDVVEHLESIAADLVTGARIAPPEWRATTTILAILATTIRPRLAASGPAERQALLDGLAGKFIRPGPSGAPSRGRLDVLPTGRNFYSVDNRAIPTPTAWELGRKSAETLVRRHLQDTGTWLTAIALSVWGTATMRTGGDDIAQALAFIGAKPVWDPASLRVSGYEIIPLARMERPRVDVTLRISGLFRDAFPGQIALFDRAVRAIGALDEPEDMNPIAARMRSEALGLIAAGTPTDAAGIAAGHRIFGSKPGTYGGGLQAVMASGQWRTRADLAAAVLDWGQYAYGGTEAGAPHRALLETRLTRIDAVVHNQDNREHDLLDSDEYYQFEGGLVAAAETLAGQRPAAYHADHSLPERPVARTLDEEISRVMRARVVNPKWIAGVMRHAYKGAFEIIATVDFMLAFAATTGAVKTHHFDLAFEAFIENETVRAFLRANNRFGYDELIATFNDARTRGYWSPRSNSVHALLAGEP